MKTPAFALCLLTAGTAAHAAGLEKERALLKADPAKAAEQLKEKLSHAPGDPWLVYNTAVAAYAAGDYTKANELWQQLSTSEMPEPLRDKVWMQIGNVSYRMAQPQLDKEPEAAIPGLEQGREALRVAVHFNKNNLTAAKNLRFIESVLEKIYARLARQLMEEAKKDSWAPRAVEKLEAALPYAHQALEMNPSSPERKEEKKEIEKLLSEKLQARAEMAEKTADQRQPEKNEWERKTAQENYEKAMEDFQQAQALTPEDPKAQEGEKRVEEKLADLHDKAGRQEQKEAQALADHRPEQAMERFEKALDHFEQAQAITPDHADAKAGEQEVKEAMEQLHLEAGDQQMARAEQQMERRPQEAAANLQQALENFEAAKSLDPQNAEIQPRIDKAEAMLPEALTKAGQQEQKQGEQAEQKGQDGQAMEDYQQAEQDFAKAEGMQPGNKEAEQGRKQAKESMERLQKKMEEMAKQQQQKPGEKPGQESKEPQEPRESFESMLAKVKEDEKYREMNARPNKGQKYDEQRDKNLRNW